MDTNPQTSELASPANSAKKAKKAKMRRKVRRLLAGVMALAIGLTATGILVNACLISGNGMK